MGITKRGLIWSLLLTSMSLPAASQTLAQKGWAGSNITVAPWWQSAVFYQIDPVSFQDSKGNGFGDLHGILERLDYLQALGVDALVITPLQSGPATARPGAAQPFDPMYGSPDDLDQLIQQAGLRKIRILVDVPLSRMIPLQETLNVARFWLSRGIAGLRLSTDSGDSPGSLTTLFTDRIRELKRLCANFPGQRVLFSDLHQPTLAAKPLSQRSSGRRHVARKDATSAGSSVPSDLAQLWKDPALEHMPMLNAAALRLVMEGLSQNRLGATPTAVVSTDESDLPRSLDRFGSGPEDVDLAKVLATALLAGAGAPLLYFGQEIGMATTPAPAANQLPAAGDPTPMQWGDAAGFSSGVPWVPMGRNASTANVALEEGDRFSLLHWYRQLIALRHGNDLLRDGAMEVLTEPNPAIVGWVRHARTKGAASSAVVVLCNLSDRPAVLSISGELHRLGIATGDGVMHTLAASNLPVAAADGAAGPVSMNSIALPAYGVYIGELRFQGGLESQPAPVRSRRGR